MTIEQGSRAFRDSPRRQVFKSSNGTKYWFTSNTSSSLGEISTPAWRICRRQEFKGLNGGGTPAAPRASRHGPEWAVSLHTEDSRPHPGRRLPCAPRRTPGTKCSSQRPWRISVWLAAELNTSIRSYHLQKCRGNLAMNLLARRSGGRLPCHGGGILRPEPKSLHRRPTVPVPPRKDARLYGRRYPRRYNRRRL